MIVLCCYSGLNVLLGLGLTVTSKCRPQKWFSNVNTVIRDKHKYSFVHQHLVFSICSLSSLTACQSAYAILRKCFCMFLLYYFVKQHLKAYNSSSLSHFPAFFNLVREHEWDVFANKTTVLEQNEEGNIPERSLTHMNTGSDNRNSLHVCVEHSETRGEKRKRSGLVLASEALRE